MNKEHFKEMAHRADQAFDDFCSQVIETINCSQSDAEKITNLYVKEKLVKRDLWMGKYTVKHGAYWDSSVLKRALNLAKERT